MTEPQVISSFFLPLPSKEKNCCENEKNETKKDNETELSNIFLHFIDELNIKLKEFTVPSPVECIYNATEYARYTFEMYVNKYCNNKKHIMYFGMNPGPWGMSQTGVPFGEVNAVKNWLGIEGPVNKPPHELKTRPVNGFECKRSEISGHRFWGLFKSVCHTPDNFFKTSFVYNYLPQQWMKNNGCNVTPSDFKVSQMKELYNICDPTFIKVLQLYEVKIIIAIGKFCEKRAKIAVENYLPSNSVKIFYLPHPSPRTVNNNDWDIKALEHLKNYDILHYYHNEGT